MGLSFYLHRKLNAGNKIFGEADLLKASRFIIVLAEPGAGKTRLLESLAQQLASSVVTANRFINSNTKNKNSPLLIDAYDELAKLDPKNVYNLLGKAHNANPSTLIISSRSSEWRDASNLAFKDFFGELPLVVRLLEFSEKEQRIIFEHHTESEDFSLFQAEVGRFDLKGLLPNPQFLKLFSDAYVQSERRFESKRLIFSKAIEYLTKETNRNVMPMDHSLSIPEKIRCASEIFAKLLLSGAEGIAVSEVAEDPLYPQLKMFTDDSVKVQTILSTQLFKPGDSVDTHRPVHKIVAEYAAADYLTKRATDTFTLEKLIPVIAPNSIVRDELRGLLGWMAALGNKRTQEVAINLDPYAVIANGDPSQLELSSKRLLLKRLQEIEENDPYFRRSDFWRRFSVAGFFTPEVVEEIKPLLSKKSGGHLRDLLLELLRGSPAIKYLTEELRAIVLSPEEDKFTRLLAINCLLEQSDRFDYQDDLSTLITEASHASLGVAAKVIEEFGANLQDNHYISVFFRACARLYPSHRELFNRHLESRHFVNHLIEQLDLAIVAFLLDDLSYDLTCLCGKESYECYCRNGISKIIGMLLDRYFVLAPGPYEPAQIWSWVKNLNFHESKTSEQSKSVQVLQNNTELRQGIIKLVLGHLLDKDKIIDAKVHCFDFHSHSGLVFYQKDYRFIVDHAYDTDNTALWLAFKARHNPFKSQSEKGPDELRRHMRAQARSKPKFMQVWVKSERENAKFEREHISHNLKHSRFIKRRHKQECKRHAATIQFIQENRSLIENGRHWSCLVSFATLVLNNPGKIEKEFGDESIVHNALSNCLDFIAPYVPSLDQLAEMQCESKYDQSETILYAACLELLRKNGTLNEVPLNFLLVLKTNLPIHHSGVQDNEREMLESEVNRLALPTNDSIKKFCQQYIEPQLSNPQCEHPRVDWLSHDPVFHHLAPDLAYNWLKKFVLMPLPAMEVLFEILAEHGNRQRLTEIIATRCAEFSSSSPLELTQEQLKIRRIFWFIRAFYFLDGTQNSYWDWLRADKNNVFLFDERSGPMNRSNNSSWPKLTASKVEVILDTFFIHWPKVPLPNTWGTNSPRGEKAYRFLSEVIWSIDSDIPSEAIPVLTRLLNNTRYSDLHKDIKSILAGMERKRALWDFEPPSSKDIVALLDQNDVVTVEGLRQRVMWELSELQREIDGGEYNTADRFYAGSERLDEESCTQVIAERLSLILKPQNISIIPERHLKHGNRCDFSAEKMISGKKRMLVTEVKGQWHKELYTAASNQLNDLYTINPHAEQQGIYLVLWFGSHEKVAGRIRHSISGANELKVKIESDLPADLRGLIDVFVLDVSRNT
ncbi:hypothetical protein [Idiomarina sp.]|uniref:hypothetical protein n=1 Tax=Idiomarina sp. TaxID=1874361 RepID=UPI0035176F8C